MAPISLDPNADTLVRVIQKGPVKVKETVFKVLAAALSASPYWKSFITHMDGASGFKPNKTHVEDTGITIVAVEIVLRGLHRSYHRRQSNSAGLKNSAESTVEGKAKDTELVTTGDASSGENGILRSGATSLENRPPVNINVSVKVDDPLPEDDDLDLPPDLRDMEVYFPHELSKSKIDDVWGVLALVNLDVDRKKKQGKFGVDWTVLRPWFFKWRETKFATFKTKEEYEKVLFPTFAFHDSAGFSYATKWLCRNTSVGNIEEYSPQVHSQGTVWYIHLHVPKNIMCECTTLFAIASSTHTHCKIAQIRIARSQLRVKVSEAIWSIVRGLNGWLSEAKCDCWIVAEYNYLKALEEAGVLCPELDHKKTIVDLVERMGKVEYEEPLDPCIRCSNTNITSHLRSAIQAASFCKEVSIPEPSESGKQKELRSQRMRASLTEVVHDLHRVEI